MKILHPDHISAYLDAAERRGALPMFYLELVSGLRKGELVALQWADLDEDNSTVSVSKQASWDTEGNLILSQPKTGNSIREVSIPQDAVELLKQEHAKMCIRDSHCRPRLRHRGHRRHPPHGHQR